MQPVSFKRHRFPPDVIRLAVWLYFRFTQVGEVCQ
jgi:putative transposase